MSSFYDDREKGWWIYQQHRRRKKMISLKNRPEGSVLPVVSGSSGVGSTPELDDYASRVVLAGGELTTNEISGLNSFISTLKSNNIWNKIYDCCTFMGGFNGAFVKLKYADASYKSMLNENFVSGDYGETTALTSTTATNKRAMTQIIPSSYGLSKNNISLGYFSLSTVSDSDTVYMMLDNQTSGAFDFNLQKATFYMNASPIKTFDIARLNTGTPRMMWYSSNGFMNWGFDFVSIYPQPGAVAVNDLKFDTQVSLWGGRNGGDDRFATGRNAFYWIGEYLTYSELKILNRAVRDLCIATGRLTEVAQVITFGDSITRGNGASVYTNAYSKLLATDWSLQEANLGLIGSRFRVSDTTVNGGYPRRDELLNYNLTISGTKVVIQYGVNDLNQDTDPAGDSAILSDITTKMGTLISDLKTAGITASNIYVGTQSQVNNGASEAKQQAYATAIRNAVTGTGARCAEVLQMFLDNGGTANLDDALHPNDAGHSLIRDAHLAATVI